MVTQAEMNALRREDEVMNRDIAKTAGRNGRQCVVDQKAFMNAVRTNGTEICTSAGRGYWNDMKRIYPHLRGGRQVDGDSANGRRNRFGKVSKRWIKGIWHDWDGRQWVEENE